MRLLAWTGNLYLKTGLDIIDLSPFEVIDENEVTVVSLKDDEADMLLEVIEEQHVSAGESNPIPGKRLSSHTIIVALPMVKGIGYPFAEINNFGEHLKDSLEADICETYVRNNHIFYRFEIRA